MEVEIVKVEDGSGDSAMNILMLHFHETWSCEKFVSILVLMMSTNINYDS